jgi:hypothetical protein
MGIADAIREPLERVERAAGAPPSYGPFALGEDAFRLTPTQRKAVMAVVEAMLDPGADAARPPLRAVAKGERAPGAAQREASEKAARVRKEQDRR